jgi:glucose dehydrogenase
LIRKGRHAGEGVVRDRFDIIPPAALHSRNFMKRLQLAVFVVSLTACGVLAQSSKSTSGDGEWPMYNRDLAGTRYSPLKQITTGNVSKLVRAWSYPLGRDQTAGTLSGGSEFTPIVVGGLMYVAASDHVTALEPETGKAVWRYDTKGGAPSRRGVAYWPGDANNVPRIFFTSERRLIALDARSGAVAAAFGNGGEIDMVAPYHSAPTVYRNLLILGTNGAPGGVRAFDARSGAKVWDFHSVPEPGQAGNQTWESDSWRNRPGTYSWAFSQTLDAERGILYVAVEAPGPNDYWGGDRHGDNLYGNSLVALDAQTGTIKWHFQAVHHDLWDYDLPSPPSLLDVAVNGRRTPVLALAAKTGYMYILDRVTGKPVFGMEERPVPPSNVPGEQSSPTQPVPVKPPPIARTSFKTDDIVTAADTNADHARFCRDLYERSGGFYNEGPFSPYVFRDAGARPYSTVLFPGSIGGANWGGTAADPTLGYVVVNTNDEASIGWIEKTPEGSRLPYRRNSIVGPTSRFQWKEGDPRTGNIMGGERGWLCQKPPWGNLVAVDARTGDIAWKVPLGITEELPAGKQNTGRLNLGGPIVTAGGLLFIGATNDRRFRAFETKTGKELWVTKLEMSAHAVPITYQGKNGKQYVAITAAGASALDDPMPAGSEALLVFALP